MPKPTQGFAGPSPDEPDKPVNTKAHSAQPEFRFDS
jgi:hypothetical protein